MPARVTSVSCETASERRGVGGPHLVAGQDGAHEAADCSATTKAMATSSVWVSERWKRPAPWAPASSARRAVQHEEGRVAGGARRRGPAHLHVGQGEGADAACRAPS